MQKPEYTVEELIEMQRRMTEAQAVLEASKRDLEEARKGKGE
jgi:hypothetical protein